MDWVKDHLQLLIAIGGAVAWWLNQRKGEQSGDGEAPPPHQEKSFDDPELAERTRRIREEIQRKIEQRAKGYASEQPRIPRAEPAASPPLVRQVVVTAAEPPPLPRMSSSRQEAQRNAEILEQQQALMERLQEAKLMKAAAQKRLEFEATTADHTAEVLAETRSTVLGDLSTPGALRRAFILREVLGPPLALR